MIRPLLQLIRWQNLIFLAILMYVMQYWVAAAVMHSYGFPNQLPWWLVLMLISAVLLIAAGGYVINDYFDVKIDRINRPKRLVVTQAVSKEQAMRLFQVLTVLGVAIGVAAAVVLRDWTIGTIFVLIPGLLWFYSSSYKRQLLVGNLIVSFAAAVVPILIALANVTILRQRYSLVMEYLPLPHDIFVWLGGFALFAFLTTFVREVIKDLQDQMGDRELECHSLPIVIGEMWTKVIVTILLLIIIALICFVHWHYMPYDVAWNSLSTRYVCFGVLVPFICEIILLWNARIPSDYRNAQLLMKFCMFMGVMYSFVIHNML
jgi:4-hydroxybenzoate polyprenyltransferase